MNLLKLVTPDKNGQPVWNEDDVVIRGMLTTREGQIMWPPPPVQVSAAPSPGAATEKAAQSAGAAQASASDSEPAQAAEAAVSKKEPSTFRKWWWKIALGALAVLLIAAAPAHMSSHFMVFVLACVVGFYVITGVSHTLHTPLMSETNAISGIIIVGALLQISSGDLLVTVLAFIAVALASINIFGGFLVTRRMLKMFERSSE